jgi:hypothetical protein
MQMDARFVRAAVIASLVGGVVVTVYLVASRFVLAHNAPLDGLLVIMQWDASNQFGDAAYQGGWGMAGMGWLMDCVVSLVWAFVFAYIYIRAPLVRRHALASGLLFGVFVMIVMIYCVVPLGHARRAPNTLMFIVNTGLAHTVFFGLPVAWTVRTLL